MSKYGLKNFVEIAKNYVEPDTSTMDGLQQFLIGYFCLKLKTNFNDERITGLTFEELLILYNMHRISEDPDYYYRVTNNTTKEQEEYEKFLKEEMKEDYVSDDDYVKFMEEYEKKEKEAIEEQFPNKITTKFEGK